jgi:hypothetical protein
MQSLDCAEHLETPGSRSQTEYKFRREKTSSWPWPRGQVPGKRGYRTCDFRERKFPRSDLSIMAPRVALGLWELRLNDDRTQQPG